MASTFKDKIHSVISNVVCSWRCENKQIALLIELLLCQINWTENNSKTNVNYHISKKAIQKQSSPSDWLSWFCVALSLVFCVMFCRSFLFLFLLAIILFVLFITVFTVFRLLTDFVCSYTYEFWLSLWKIVGSSVILLLPLFDWGILITPFLVSSNFSHTLIQY